MVTSDDDTKAWLDSAACQDECRDRLAGGLECRDTCERYLRAVETWRKATPERRTGFVSRRRLPRQQEKIESLS